MQTINHQENTQPMYGAPSAQTVGSHPQSGAAPVQGAGYPSTHDNAYGSNPTTGTTNTYGNHPHNNVDGHNHNESTVDKIKDHIKGNHSHNPQNGGGFGAGYTGNDHGHVNHDSHHHHNNNQAGFAATGAGVGATSTNQPQYGAPAHEKPSTMDKLKNAVSGDKNYNDPNNPTYGAPPAGAVGATGAHGSHHHAGHTAPIGGASDTTYNNTTHSNASGINPTYGAPGHNTASHNPLSSNNNNTQAQYGAPNSTNPVGVNDHHHHNTNTHSSHNNHHAAGTTKPSIGDKISGTMDTIVGKMTNNDAKVAQGEVKKVYGKDAADAGLANAQAHEGRY